MRQTDGPGDGKRDVHSIARDGRRHLTQCKHHDDCEVACTSDELSELPVGLVKFGIPQGLFVTDARISPQAKREYLEDYRQLELEFLDAEELLAEVLSRSPLRALWFDGGKLGAINSRVTFPVIFRRHDTDRPVMPLRHVSLREGMFGVIRGEAAQLGLVAEARESASERAPFERYRLPTRLTMEEGSRSELQVTEIGFRGGMALHELEALAETLALALASSVSSGIGPVSVVVGRAFVTPLEGEDAGLRTLTDASRVTAVGINGSGLLESRWFKPDPEGKWDDTCDARVTEAGWVRLYHAAMNVAAACEVVTTAGPFDAVLRQTTRLGWTRSVFALLPAWKKWPRDDIPEPDDRIDWTYEPGQILCGWLHPLTGGTPIPVPSDHGDDESLPLFDERAADLALSDLRDRVATIANARLVEPERARHMLALVSRDPLAGDDEPTTFGTADVLAAFEGLARRRPARWRN